MNGPFFVKQIERLKIRFGEKAFDPETLRLIRREVENMPEREFELLTDALISTRPHQKAPLVADFREGRLNIERRMLNAQTFGASKAFQTPWNTGLKAYLEKKFLGCKTLNEAIQVRKLQIQLAKAENPNYDPMTDPEWQ